MIHFQGQEVGSCDFGLLQREVQSSRLVGIDGVPASVALAGTWVWPRISHSLELCPPCEHGEAITRSGQRQVSWDLVIETKMGGFH